MCYGLSALQLGPASEKPLFFLAFGVETGIPSFRTMAYDEMGNEKTFRRELDLIEERMNEAKLRNAIDK